MLTPAIKQLLMLENMHEGQMPKSTEGEIQALDHSMPLNKANISGLFMTWTESK